MRMMRMRMIMIGAMEFDALYSTFHSRILRYLVRLIGPDQAEDVAQEVFVKISRSLGEF